MRIDGISALVTGGASGLGRATVQELAGRGASVTIADLPGSDGAAVAKELGGRVRFAPADITAEDEVNAAIAVAGQAGPLRAVVHCAGRGGDRVRIIDREHQPGPLDTFRQVIEVNLIGTYNVLRLAAAAMSHNEPADGDRGAIVLTASVAAFDGQIGQAAYAASKGGVVGMTLPVARDLAAIGVRVCTIAPGLIDTPIYGEGAGSEAFKEKLKRDVLFPRRLGVAEEFATLAVEVLANSYMNAEVIRLDGGARLQPK